MAAQGFNRLDQVRQYRRETNVNGVTIVNEPGRTIVQEGDQTFLLHDETERFRDLGGNLRTQRRDGDTYVIYDRPGDEQIVTVTDQNGRLLRRIRRFRDGREIVLIDNTIYGPPRSFDEDVVILPRPPIALPRERYIVEAENADEGVIYETLSAAPVAPIPQRYTLDQVRYSPDLRAYMRSVDVNTINFDSGSWTVSPDQVDRLAVLARALRQAIQSNPSEVFLIEGHTDAVGNPVDNLSLSDRRAQSVATILTQTFSVPPENLTTQGYGSQYPKVQTSGPSRENRRVTVRRITPLLTGQNAPQ